MCLLYCIISLYCSCILENIPLGSPNRIHIHDSFVYVYTLCHLTCWSVIIHKISMAKGTYSATSCYEFLNMVDSTAHCYREGLCQVQNVVRCRYLLRQSSSTQLSYMHFFPKNENAPTGPRLFPHLGCHMLGHNGSFQHPYSHVWPRTGGRHGREKKEGNLPGNLAQPSLCPSCCGDHEIFLGRTRLPSFIKWHHASRQFQRTL